MFRLQTAQVNTKEISQKTCSYYETLFRKKPSKSETETKQFLGNVTTLILINSLKNLFKKELSKDGLYKAMICMPNSKFPENDYRTKEFYERFWNYLKAPYVMSIKQYFIKKLQTLCRDEL